MGKNTLTVHSTQTYLKTDRYKKFGGKLANESKDATIKFRTAYGDAFTKTSHNVTVRPNTAS